MGRLSNSEIKDLIKAGLDISKNDIVDVVEFEGVRVMRVNGKYAFFSYNDKWIPTLRRVYEKGLTLKSVYVDVGAIKFVANGADVMRPGIVKVDDGILKGDVICVREVSHNKVIALGEAFLSSDDMKSAASGKMIKNIHYVGDKLWNLG
ncbi:MAG: DUF1947 domain-containing protein [Candidatus Micrarchaeia archaeon]